MSFLQIASWNIEHLSGQPRATRRQTVYALADHIEMAASISWRSRRYTSRLKTKKFDCLTTNR